MHVWVILNSIKPGIVLRSIILILNKTLYGSRDAANRWFIRHKERMVNIGMTQSSTDPCLYTKGHIEDDNFVAVGIRLTSDLNLMTNEF